MPATTFLPRAAPIKLMATDWYNQRSTTFGVQIGLRLLHWDSYHRMITNEISNRNWSTWGWYQKDMYRRRQQHHLLPRKHRISQGSHNTQWDSCRIHHPHHHHLCQLDRRGHHKDSHHKMDGLLTSGLLYWLLRISPNSVFPLRWRVPSQIPSSFPLPWIQNTLWAHSFPESINFRTTFFLFERVAPLISSYLRGTITGEGVTRLFSARELQWRTPQVVATSFWYA